jgi:protein-S-isoprenylcysteine O-methyltransferase Ste14
MRNKELRETIPEFCFYLADAVIVHPRHDAQQRGLPRAAPVLPASWWAGIPSALTVTLLILRTALEDRALQAELAGYAAYARRVRHRLVPGVW